MGTYVFTVQAFDRDPPEAGGTVNYTAADDCVMLYVICLQHIPTRGYNITQSSAPDDGHMVAPKHVEQLLEEK